MANHFSMLSAWSISYRPLKLVLGVFHSALANRTELRSQTFTGKTSNSMTIAMMAARGGDTNLRLQRFPPAADTSRFKKSLKSLQKKLE